MNNTFVILAETIPSEKRNYYNGGIEVGVESLISFLQKKFPEAKIHLIAQQNHINDSELKEYSGISIHRVKINSGNIVPSWKRLFDLIKIQFAYYKIISEIQPTKIFATSHTNFLIAQISGIILRKPVVLYWADILGFIWISHFGLVGILGLTVETVSRNNLFCEHWTNSQTTKQKLKKNDTFVLSPYFKGGIKNANYKKLKQILMVSRLVKYKCVDEGIEVFSEVHKKFLDFKLVIVGDGPEKGNLLNLITKLDLEKFVEIKSNVAHKSLEKLYEDSLIFLHMSIIEGYCIVIQEAHSYGCFVIAKELPVLKETTKGLSNVYLLESKTAIINKAIEIINTGN